jgi:hypothetical protein
MAEKSANRTEQRFRDYFLFAGDTPTTTEAVGMPISSLKISRARATVFRRGQSGSEEDQEIGCSEKVRGSRLTGAPMRPSAREKAVI